MHAWRIHEGLERMHVLPKKCTCSQAEGLDSTWSKAGLPWTPPHWSVCPAVQFAGERAVLWFTVVPLSHENITVHRQGHRLSIYQSVPLLLINTGLNEWTRPFPQSRFPWGRVADSRRMRTGALERRTNTMETAMRAWVCFRALPWTGAGGSTPLPRDPDEERNLECLTVFPGLSSCKRRKSGWNFEDSDAGPSSYPLQSHGCLCTRPLRRSSGRDFL